MKSLEDTIRQNNNGLAKKRNKEGKKAPRASYNSTLEAVLDVLGWKEGTIWQVIDEISRLKRIARIVELKRKLRTPDEMEELNRLEREGC